MEENENNLSEELKKALLDIFDGDKEEVDSLLEKAKKPDDDDMDDENEPEEEGGEDDDEDMEKAYNKMKSELDSMKKSYNEKMKSFKDMSAKLKSKKSEETSPKGVEKSEDKDFGGTEADKKELIKSLSVSISKDFKSRLEEIEKANKEEIEKANKEEIDELRKSVNESFGEIKKSLEAIGSTPMGRRAAIKETDVLTKADDFHSDVVQKSLSDRAFIESALDNMIEKSEAGAKTKYQNALLNLNAGGVMPNESILNEISKSENVKFTK